MSAKVVRLKQGREQRNATSSARGRQRNEVYRVREHLTEAEIEKLLAALKQNRYGHRDWLIGLLTGMACGYLRPVISAGTIST